ncbi:hypothetical protein EU805_01685 [Salipiger sp. IMCC34102]|uniref:SWIM zinc finger family protein n=1 Tax=Salipiger sp. IMCC34102 TaxID=2510647 RepID=UPI00101B9FC7|nr:SWIM zinc finger family protein [Salipiger sp. IMCC34102]RYH04109.1 hypothetical protein EU805_01685 [Salipiger sp. IMCC34102]
MKILVKSKSSGAEYTVEVFTEGDIPMITCSCPAGANGKACKHRFSLLNGDWKEVKHSSHSAEDFENLLHGSQLREAITEMRQAEETILQAQANHRRLKSQVNRLMQGRVE